MRLVRLDIEHFRRITNQRVDWHPVTVLFGPNDAGKSSVLAAMEATFRSVAGEVLDDNFAQAAIAIDLDPRKDPDMEILSQLQSYGSVWAHDSVRPGEGDLAAGFQTDISGGDAWSGEVFAHVDLHGGDEARLADSLVSDLALECSDDDVLDDAREVFTAAIASRVFRIDTSNGWQWSADDLGLSPPTREAVSRLQARLAELTRAADPRDGRTRGWAKASKWALWELHGALWALQAGGEYLKACSWDVKRPAAVVGLWRVVRIGDPDAGRREAEAGLAATVEWLVAQVHRGANVSGWSDRWPDDRGGGDPWLEERDDGWVRIAEAATATVAEASKLANALAPEFVTRDYEIRIDVNPPSRWRAGDLGSRLTVRLRLHSDAGRGLRLTEVGSALGVWTSYVVLEAARQLRVQLEAASSEERRALTPEQQFERFFGFDFYDGIAGDTRPDLAVSYGEWLDRAKRFPLFPMSSVHTVYLFDEPERHLHPLAQIEARAWIARLASTGECSVVLATHSIEFLDIPLDSAQYIRMTRDIDRKPQLVPITEDVLGGLRAEVELLGLQASQLIHLTRIWLVVEGEHDAMIIRHYYGRALERARVTLFILRGVKNALAIGQLEHLASYQAPIRAIFDDAIASGVVEPERPKRRTSLEERAASAMRRLFESKQADFELEELAFPDVLCVLPEDAVRQTLTEEFKGRSNKFLGWDAIQAGYAAAVAVEKDKPDFKQFFLQSVGLKGGSH